MTMMMHDDDDDGDHDEIYDGQATIQVSHPTHNRLRRTCIQLLSTTIIMPCRLILQHQLLLLLLLLTHLTQGRHSNSTKSISDEVKEGRTERSDGTVSKHAVTNSSHGVFAYTEMYVTIAGGIFLE